MDVPGYIPEALKQARALVPETTSKGKTALDVIYKWQHKGERKATLWVRKIRKLSHRLF